MLGDGFTEVGLPDVGWVARGVVALDFLGQPRADAGIGREIRVADPQRDHVDAGRPLLRDHAVHPRHDVLGDRVHAVREAHDQIR